MQRLLLVLVMRLFGAADKQSLFLDINDDASLSHTIRHYQPYNRGDHIEVAVGEVGSSFVSMRKKDVARRAFGRNARTIVAANALLKEHAADGWSTDMTYSFVQISGHCTKYTSIQRWGHCDLDHNCVPDAQSVTSLELCMTKCTKPCKAIAYGKPNWHSYTGNQCVVYFGACTPSGVGMTNGGLTYYHVAAYTQLSGTCNGFTSLERWGYCSIDTNCQPNALSVDSLDMCKAKCTLSCTAVAWGQPHWYPYGGKQCVVYFGSCTDSGSYTDTHGLTHWNKTIPAGA